MLAFRCSSPAQSDSDAGTDAVADQSTDAVDVDAGADAVPSTSKMCPSAGDPVACDDSTGASACTLGKQLGASAAYHLTVSGSMFTTIGACLYVTPTTCSSTSGDVLEFSGGEGTMPAQNPTIVQSPYCFRSLSVVWDSNWADNGSTTGGPAGLGGNVLAASQRPKALITWVHSYLRSTETTPLCATGGSAGSSLLLYQVMHDDGEQLLDHVQVTSATPYARFDKGCNTATPAEGAAVVCSGLPASTAPQYGFLYGGANPGAIKLVQGDTHDPNCDVDGSAQTASEAAALQAMSLVTSGFAPMTLHQTSLSAFMCATIPNATQGQAVYIFGANADLAAADAGPYTGLIALDLSTPFYGCAAGTHCMPHIVCDPSCATETFGASTTGKVALAEDLKNNCVLRH